MGCSCGATKTQFETDPGDSCLFCTEKHLSLASTILSCQGIKPGTRQLIIGELELARRHSILGFPAVGSAIVETEQAIVGRNDNKIAVLLDKTLSVCETSIATLETEDKTVLVYSNSASTAAYNPIAGELFLSTAFRLACEDGYEQTNRSSVLGELTAAQYHMSKLGFGDRIREVRKKIEARDPVDKQEWLSLLVDADAIITGAIKAGASADVSWYISR